MASLQPGRIASPLLAATQTGEIKIVKYLLARGAPVIVEAGGGSSTALHSAVQSSTPLECIQLLMDAGMSLEARASNGTTALNLAAKLQRSEVASFLLRKGAQVDAVCNI